MKFASPLWFAFLGLFLSLLGGCGDDGAPALDGGSDAAFGDAAADATVDATADAGGDTGPPPFNELPALSDLEPTWNELLPGGPTVCSRGSEFAFFVHPGTVNKVIVDFIGGGACWNADTCSFADALFADSVEPVRRAVAMAEPVGIYDRSRADNPFRDWTHVVVPYCTGDVHWGDARTEYGDGPGTPVVINHRGAVNARAVLDWVYENVPAPEQAFVTGCSAGSYGSIVWAAHLMEHYPGVRVVQLGDSGAGVITETFFRESFPSWNATGALPDWIPDLDPARVDIFELELADLYIGIGDYYPGNVVAQYNTTFDENQTFFYEAMGGTGGAAAWSEKMIASTSRIVESTPNYRNFRAPGEQHCVIMQPNFYEVESNGVRLVDWIGDLVAGRNVENVACVDCSRPTPGTE